MENKNFLAAKFGIEVEFTGITRRQAAEVAARYLGGTITETRDSYGTCKVTAPDGRVWKFVYDGSIYTQKRVNGEKVSAGREYSVELVSPILAAQAVLLPAEKEMGVVLIDIGGGTTDIAYFEGGKLLHASVLPVGGDYITRDLAIVLKTSLEHAVKIKEEDGVAGPEQASDANIIKVQNLRGKEVRQVSQQVIADIINARVVELIEMIYAELKRFGCLEQMPGGIVLTGGAAQLKGIDEVMEKHLDITVRLGIPENLRGVQSDINRPEYATVIGGLIYAGNNLDLSYENKPRVNGLFNKINYWLRDFFA